MLLFRQPCEDPFKPWNALGSSKGTPSILYTRPTTRTMTNLKLPDPIPRGRGIVVFSGGSAANNLVDVFNEIASNRKASLSYIIPISDNGGSSSELIRVFGGPGIGDIRSDYFS